MPVTATRLLRRLRGGAQAHLLEADDGGFYVTKFLENPQHRRILVNEWVSAVLLRYLNLPCASADVVVLTEEFLAREAELYIQLGSRRLPVRPGWHFGSRYPVPPDKQAVYDYLPDSLLAATANLPDFLGMLVFDKWVGNADSRQSVFFRANLRPWLKRDDLHPAQKGFVALMIDHGYAFDGPNWTFTDSPLQGLYYRPLVYECVKSIDDFEPWLTRVVEFPQEVMDEAWRTLPPSWLEDDEPGLLRIFETLLRRRSRVRDLLHSARAARGAIFPNWA
jgi:hypothetical protein